MHAQYYRIVIQYAWRSWPQWMRKTLGAFRKTERQIVRQWRYILVRKVILPDEDKNHSVDLMHRIRSNPGGTDQFIFRVGNDSHQLAAGQIEGKSVVPTGDCALAKTSRFL
ncbi:hypothetical protein D3C81_1947890 [compost metagenome]